MKTFQLIYAETRIQVWTIILVPLTLTAVFIAVCEEIGFENIRELRGTSIFIATLVITILLVIHKLVNRPAEVKLTDESMIIRLNKKSLFYRWQEVTIPMENILRLTEDRNTQNDNKKYFSIQLKNPSRSLVLMQPRKMDDKEMDEFSSALHGLIDNYNLHSHKSSAARIMQGSFYDAKWAMIFTWMIYAVIVASTVIYATGVEVQWYKLIPFYIFGGIWLLAYHTNKTRKVKV